MKKKIIILTAFIGLDVVRLFRLFGSATVDNA